MKMSAKKRDARQYIVINEERLINEVQRRPILYDKALKGYRKPTIRENAWQEVATLVDSTVEESKKRWRSLRDAFMKQYKQFAADDKSTSKKKKWLFYDHMEFLRPFLEISELQLSRSDYMEEYITHKKQIPKVEFVDSSKPMKLNVIVKQPQPDSHHDDDDDGGIQLNDGGIDDSRIDINEETAEIDEDEEQLEEHENEEVIDMYEDRDIISEIFTPGLHANNQDQSHQQQEEEQQPQEQQHTSIHHHHLHQQQAQHHNQHQLQHQQIHPEHNTSSTEEQNIEIASVSTYGLDPDERFLLSCAPILKRLSNKKNALARLKVQQILYEIEFGEAMF